jgi:hypothetical protein
MTRNTMNIITILATLAAASPALADSTPDAEITESSVEMDIEIDPIAYVLSGYSLHARLSWDRFRLDLGAFALAVPESLHGTEGVDVYGGGFGMKLDYHPLSKLPGLFVGAQLSRFRETVTDRATGEAATASHVTMGARIGYRIDVAAGFYALPWVGVDVSLTDRTQTVAGTDYEPGRVMFFPTIHIGRSF